MDVRRLLDQLRADSCYHGQIVHIHRFPARPARHEPLDPPLPEPLRAVLEGRGIQALYSHQARAVAASREGRDVVVVTSTASGKTLCYNLPILEELLEFPHARALYLFPTKALGQDQLKALRRLTDADPELMKLARAGVYDGDTPQSTRKRLRDEGNLILSNPDMLHSGILPQHTRWARFWANLRTVVIDELHTYRGILGSNVANVLRRLERICDHYGSRPRFICSSATIANPKELAERLTGREFHLVDDDGSPKGEKWFVFWNPPHLDAAKMERGSSSVEAERLMVHLLRQGVQTIAFGRARIVAELLYRYVREQLRRDGPRMAAAVRAYRGGYLAAERREIEQMLFNGQLLGVTSTNALELGIDVGGLDAAIILGFPGTVASTWQQAGRAGRGLDPSIVFFVAYNDPTDQFICRKPDYITGRSPEAGIVDPENVYIQSRHLGCAAAELPLRREDERYFGPKLWSIAEALADDGQLKPLGPAFYWSRPEQPAHKVGLRVASDNTVTIIERPPPGSRNGSPPGENRVIAQVDRISAPELVYPEAVYLHEGQTYLVESLDLEQKVAYVRREDVDYYTNAILESVIQIQAEEVRRPLTSAPAAPSEREEGPAVEPPAGPPAPATVHYGEVEVSWATVAFKKIQFYSTDSLGWGAVDLPPQHLRTTGVWLAPSTGTLAWIRAKGRNPVEGLAGIRNAAVHILPLYAMCDKQDIGGMVNSSNLGTPAVFLYDRYPGGVGFAEQGYERMEELLAECRELIRSCDCAEGCPSCVGLPTIRPAIHSDPDAGHAFPIPSKESALLLLAKLLDG